FDKACSECEPGKENYIGTFTRYTQPLTFNLLKKDVFASSETLRFENTDLEVPIGYKEYLSTLHGLGYMNYPPLEQRVPRHPGLFLTDIPFRRITDTFKDAEDKDIIVFGSGEMFEHYWNHYGDQHRPLFIADNSSAKWDTSKHGIPIKDPKDILTIEEDKRHVIICSIHHRAIGKQLEKMGIHDYFIYVQDWKWL
ncbi:hypothetical protein PAT3040_00899, partial [Paenibacillus agaridevorans]